MFALSDSRKLTGLALVLAVLFALFVVYVVASIWVDVDGTVVGAISSAISVLGLGHQGAQALADRSPNYPNVPKPPP